MDSGSNGSINLCGGCENRQISSNSNIDSTRGSSIANCRLTGLCKKWSTVSVPSALFKHILYICFLIAIRDICLGLSLFAEASFASEQLESMYCGESNCYELLEVKRDSTPAEIKKAYRRSSLLWHPDKNSSPEAPEKFRKIAKAYSVLSAADVRGAYDYYLDNPNDLYALYYGIRAVYPQKTNPLLVMFITLAFLSLGQYINNKYQYKRLYSGIKQSAQFQRMVATEIEVKYGAKFKKQPQQQQNSIRAEIEDDILTDRVCVNDGKPVESIKWTDLFIVQFFLLPLHTSNFCRFWVRWIWKFWLMGDDYGDDEKELLTISALEFAKHKWKNLTEEKRKEYLSKQLWIKEKADQYKKEKAEIEREKRVNNTRYRQWKRWKKRNPDTGYMMDD